MKQKVSKYIERNYAEGSRPDPRTIISRIERGELAGCKEGGLWFVYLQAPSTGNTIADRILEAEGCK